MNQLLLLIKKSSFEAKILSFYIFIWFLQIGDRVPLLGKIRIEFIVGTLLIFLCFKNYFAQKRLKLDYPRQFLLSIKIFYLFLIIFTFISFNFEHSLYVFTERVIKFSMITVFISLLVNTKEDLIILLIGFMLAMMKITQEGYFGVFTGGLIWENQGIPRLHGVTGLYRHPNSLAGLAVSALPFFVFLLSYQSKIVKLIFFITIGGLFLMILYAGSRTGYIGALVLVFCFFKKSGLFKFKTLILLVISIVIIVNFIPEGYIERFESIYQSKEDRGSSANKRMEIIEDAASIFLKHPLGVGVQAFPYVRNIEFGRMQDTHNLYLEVLTNLGVFGFIAFLCFIVLLLKTNNKTRVLCNNNGLTFVSTMCYIVNIYVILRLFLGLFGMDLYEVYWWFAAGITIALHKLSITMVDEIEHSANLKKYR